MIDYVLAIIVGICLGTLTGLIPGLHTNLVTTGLLAFLVAHPTETPLPFIIGVVALACTHTLMDFIPSIFLGAPGEDSFLAVLPGHELIKEGKGQEACIIAGYGVGCGIAGGIVLALPFLVVLPALVETLTTSIPYLLFFLTGYLVFREGDTLRALLLTALIALLGLSTFSLPIKEPLLPLLSGLFGLAGLLSSLADTPSLPPQQPATPQTVPLRNYFSILLPSALITPFCSFLPGIGSGHAATLIAETIRPEKRQFLFITGFTSAFVLLYSFYTLFAINKARTGAAATVQALLPTLTTDTLFIITGTMFLAFLLSFPLFLLLTNQSKTLITKIPYRTLTLTVIVLILLANLFLTNLPGLLVLATSTALGFCTIRSGIRRINLMVALIVPAIVYYLMNQ